MHLSVQLILVSLAGLGLGSASVEERQAAQDCNAPECGPVINGSACFAAGMSSSVANILRCVQLPGQSNQEAMQALCNCYTCAGGQVATTMQRSGQCPA